MPEAPFQVVLSAKPRRRDAVTPKFLVANPLPSRERAITVPMKLAIPSLPVLGLQQGAKFLEK
jgi:hypothetical protein